MGKVLILSVITIAIGFGGVSNDFQANLQAPNIQNEAPQKNHSKQQKQRKIKIGLIGYFLLPDDYQIYKTNDLRDAWYGYILSPDKTFRNSWTSGLVQNAFQTG